MLLSHLCGLVTHLVSVLSMNLEEWLSVSDVGELWQVQAVYLSVERGHEVISLSHNDMQGSSV